MEVKTMNEDRPIIGLVSATSAEPTSSDNFVFWLTPGTIVNPFDIVEAEQIAHDGTSRTFGIVTTLEHTTDAPTHLANFISNDFGQVGSEPNTVRQGTTVANVSVLSNDKDIYMPVSCDRPVRFADEAGIHVALGVDKIHGHVQRHTSGGLLGFAICSWTRRRPRQHHGDFRLGDQDKLRHVPDPVHPSDSRADRDAG